MNDKHATKFSFCGSVVKNTGSAKLQSHKPWATLYFKTDSFILVNYCFVIVYVVGIVDITKLVDVDNKLLT